MVSEEEVTGVLGEEYCTTLLMPISRWTGVEAYSFSMAKVGTSSNIEMMKPTKVFKLNRKSETAWMLGGYNLECHLTTWGLPRGGAEVQ